MNILYLAQRVPEPPNKGDKIRSHHLARRLAARHAVHLGFLLDDASEAPFARAAAGWAASCRWRVRGRMSSAVHGASSALRGRPISSGWFRSPGLARDLDATMRETAFDVAVAYCSSMATYLERFEGPRVLDLVDVDSEKWKQYAARSVPPRRTIFALEHRLLRREERRLVDAYERGVVISGAERDLLGETGPIANVSVVSNGVDVESWTSTAPAPPRRGLVFVGALDYFANADGIAHFARAVFPRIRAAVPETRLEIVGRRPGGAVRDLASIDGVDVVGEVDDVRPHVWGAAVCVAPLRIAQGLQNKVLEAMAAGTPVVATPAAVRGFDGAERGCVAVAPTDEEFVKEVVTLLRDREEGGRRAARARELVSTRYSWDRSARDFEAILEDAVRSRRERVGASGAAAAKASS